MNKNIEAIIKLVDSVFPDSQQDIKEVLTKMSTLVLPCDDCGIEEAEVAMPTEPVQFLCGECHEWLPEGLG